MTLLHGYKEIIERSLKCTIHTIFTTLELYKLALGKESTKFSNSTNIPNFKRDLLAYLQISFSLKLLEANYDQPCIDHACLTIHWLG